MSSAPRRAARGPAAAALLFLAGCGASPGAGGVVHLDPRLESGASSARELALHGARKIVSELAPAGPAAELGAWRIANAELRAGPDGAGCFVYGNVEDSEGFKKVELVLEQPFAADEVDAIELVLAHTQRGLARVTWTTAADAPGADTWIRNVNAHVEDGSGEQVVRILLADHPEWKGEIRKLVIVPKQDGWQRFQLVAVRLLGGGFSTAPDPLGGDSGDAGLAALGREARRTWPSDFDVPLVARARIPEHARLALEVALSGRARGTPEPVCFAVDARRPGDPWRNLEHLELPPGEGRELAWRELEVDLAAFGGGECEVRLRSFRGPFRGDMLRGTGGTLERPSVYWGEPLVIAPPGRDPRPNIVLVTLDTTRADALGAFGKGPSRTPYFDALAARSLAFTNAWTACNATTPSHASLLTGLAVQDHGVTDNRSMLGPESLTLAELLRAAGWSTAAAVSVEHLQPGKSGLGQGFDRFLLAESDASRDGAVTIRGVKHWLEEWKREGERPFFLWVHLFDAHTPYGPPQEFLDAYCKRYGIAPPPKHVAGGDLPANLHTRAGEFLEGVDNRAYADFLYQAAVAYDDALVENLASELARQGWLANTALAVVADHGESLGEHDHWFNHLGLYGEVMHVPLILHRPGDDAGRRVDDLVWTLDLAPTLLALAGLPRAPDLRGVDLLARTPGSPERRLWFAHSDLTQVGCRDGERHFIRTLVDFTPWDGAPKRAKGESELYDWRSDPGLLHDLAGAQPATVETYGADLEKWQASALSREGVRGKLTPEDEQRLNKLGYAGDL